MRNIYLVILALLPFFSTAQDVLDITRADEPVLLDGRVDEPAWKSIEPLPMVMFTPVFKDPMTEKTEIRITYDQQFIYASGIFYDSESDGIQGNSLVRDADNGGDFFNILIDSFNDNETFVTFTTTPAGNRIDSEISNDAEGDFSAFYNLDWNAYWDTQVEVFDWGWSAETRISFLPL